MKKKNNYFTFFSPAKINLFFNVLKKRKDGYHEIASLYQAIDLFDVINIKLKKSSGNEYIYLKSPNLKTLEKLPFDDNNLIYKAYKLFKEKLNKQFYIDIILEKNIPVKAGLGGGSSNAATTLFALNELFNKPFSFNNLYGMAISIGSDVAFFLSTGSSVCRGRGEKIEDFNDYKSFSCFLLTAENIHMSTPLVYKNVDMNLLEKRDFKSSLEGYKKSINFHPYNDLEISAFSLNNDLREIKEKLIAKGAKNVCMTGSGSAFFYFAKDAIDLKGGFFNYRVNSIKKLKNDWYYPIKY